MLVKRMSPESGAIVELTVECATAGHGRCKDTACACWCHPPVICPDAEYHKAGYICATCRAGVSIGRCHHATRAEARACEAQAEEDAAELWEIQHYTLCDGWTNTSDPKEADQYATEAEAEAALAEYLGELKEAQEYGEIEAYDPDDFRIVQIR